MSWTYTNTDPSASDLNAVRFEISDTDPNAPLLQDAEIAYAILLETGIAPATPMSIALPGLYSAAAHCCEVLARLFAAQADTETGDLTVTYSKQAVTYAARAAELRVKGQGMNPPLAGGLSWSAKQAARCDPDRIPPTFHRGQFRNRYLEGDGGHDGE